MTAKDHNRLVGIFLMIHGGFQALIMLFLGLIYGGVGAAILFGGKNEEKFVGLFFIIAIAILFLFAAIFVAPQIIGGWKMLKEKPNAKIWGIIGSILACLNFPLGTAAGVYGLWFIFGDQGKQHFLTEGNQNYVGNVNQVRNVHEPHSWK